MADLLGKPLSAAGTALRDGGRPHLAAPRAEVLPAGRRGPLALGILADAGRRPWAIRPAALVSGLLPAGRTSTDKLADGWKVTHAGTVDMAQQGRIVQREGIDRGRVPSSGV